MSDYIKREDAIKELRKEWEDAMVAGITASEILSDSEDAIYRVPSADVIEHPKGEWIDLEIPLEDGGSMPAQACNLCKTFYPLAYTGGGHNFCPNCGARMKGADGEREGE